MTHTERSLSHDPALQLLQALGWVLISPEEALRERGGRYSGVLLEEILHAQLQKLNRIHYRGSEHLFSEANIQEAIQRLKVPVHRGLLANNQEIYERLTLGTSLTQVIEGDQKSYALNYIDWNESANNTFHVVSEFTVENTASDSRTRPDIVLFVNGIPLAVIECKAPDIDIDKGISQQIRNQSENYIPKLFHYAQLLLSINSNTAKYGTVYTDREFWSIWKERQFSDKDIQAGVQDSSVTEQDRAIFCLCSHKRLLELTQRFILFEHKQKKIARYQQYSVIRSTLKRIRRRRQNHSREGGIIWHTQGSGKSLTMVMLIRNLMLDKQLANTRFVLVTDRVDLDEQLHSTFKECGLDNQQARSGRQLLQLIQNKERVITTVLDKFGPAWKNGSYSDDSSEIFVLVDECHRSHYNELAAPMYQMLPNACYLGFTGTPLQLRFRNTFLQFGELIQPSYSVQQAVKDKAVVCLKHESRYVEITQNEDPINKWFLRITAGMSDKEKADMKKKMSQNKVLQQTDKVVYMRAWDISEHYTRNWRGNGKAQLVVPSKAVAVKYYRALKEIGDVNASIVFSAPDMREGYEQVDAVSTKATVEFWKTEVIKRGHGEEAYNNSVITRFKDLDDRSVEILIVVDKLLTGFDAPVNTVMYLCRHLRGHTLLQAIARVNRLREGKDYGLIVDYVGVLGDLTKALHMYDALEGYDAASIAETLTSIQEDIDLLPQHHRDLLTMFDRVRDKSSSEKMEAFLEPEDTRQQFYDLLRQYANTMSIAMANTDFLIKTEAAQLKRYKEDLKHYMTLRRQVQLRYAEKVDFAKYEKRIRRLMNSHIHADEVMQLHEPYDIFDDAQMARMRQMVAKSQVQEKRLTYGAAAVADRVAHATKRNITQRMEEDPALHAKFSEMIQQAIDRYRQQLITAEEYLQEVVEVRDRFTGAHNHRDDVPERIAEDADACAYFGKLQQLFQKQQIEITDNLLCDTALAVKEAFQQRYKVDFWRDNDAVNRARQDIEDFLLDHTAVQSDIPADDAFYQLINEILAQMVLIGKQRVR